MVATLNKLPPDLRQGFLAYYRRQRAWKAVRVVFSTLAFYAVLVWIAVHVDRFAALTIAQRVELLWGVHCVAGGILGVRLLVLFAKRCPVVRVARELEARLGAGTQERYSTLVDILGRDERDLTDEERARLRALTQETLRLGHHRRARALVRDRWLFATLGVTALLFLALFLPVRGDSYQFGLMLWRFYLPRSAVERPSFVTIEAMPSAKVIGKGREFLLQVRTRGAVPRVWVKVLAALGRMLSDAPSIAIAAEGASTAEPQPARPLTRVGEGQYIFTRADVQQGFSYRVSCGDARTPVDAVEVVAVPRITDITLHVTPPAYSGLDRHALRYTGQTLPFLKETQVRLVFKTDQPVARRVIQSDIVEKPIEPQWDEQTNTGVYRFVLRDKMTLRIEVANARGFANDNPPRLSFRLLDDRPPSVLLQAEDVRREVSAADEIALHYLAEDDYGVSEIAVSYIVNPAPGQQEGAKEVKQPLYGRRQKVSDVAYFDLRSAGVYPGDRVLVRLRARDSAGQSGFSQGVLINISSFGRGVREEMRVKALRFLGDALELAAESAAVGKDDDTANFFISGGIYRRILTEAKQKSIAIPEDNSLLSLIQLMQQEHFFTASPWDKEDLRKMAAVLWVSAQPAAGRSNVIAFRNETVLQVVDDVLTPLADYRELKTLMWRYFGLRDAVLAMTGDGARVDRNKLTLVFDTLDDALFRTRDLPRRLPSLDADRLAAQAREVARLRGALLGAPARTRPQRGAPDYSWDEGVVDDQPERPAPRPTSPAARKAELEHLADTLGALLAVSREAVPEALSRRQTARRVLDDLYLGLAEQVLTPPQGGAVDAAWWRRAMTFMEDDTRLAAANPYPSIWTLVRNYTVSQRLLAARRNKPTDTTPPAAAAAFARSAPAACARQALDQDQLFAYSELMSLLRDRSISPAERDFAARLLAIELAERSGDASDRQQSALRAMSLTRDPAQPFALLSQPQTICEGKADYRAAEGRLRMVILSEVGTTSLLDDAGALVAAFQATTKALNDKPAAREALVYEKQVLRCLVERTWLELALSLAPETDTPPPAAAGDPALTPARALEQFYLKIREFRYRPPLTLNRLELAPGEGQLDVKDFDDVDLDYRALIRHRRAAADRLAGIVARFKARKEQDLNDYQQVLREEFEQTRATLAACLALADSADRSALARRYVRVSDEETMAFLSASLPRLRAVQAPLDEARAAAQGAKYAERLRRARDVLQEYLNVLALARSSVFIDHITEELRKVDAGLGRLAAGEADAAAAVYETEALARKLRDLSREIETYAVRLSRLRFTGGARESWHGLNEARIHETGKLLADDVGWHRERVSVAVFGLLEPSPPPGGGDMALLHAAFVYRVVRSDLARFRPMEPILAGKGQPDYVGFLRSVLGEAMKVPISYYTDTTSPYLGRMGGYQWKLPKKKK